MSKPPRLHTLKPSVQELKPQIRTGGASWRDGKTTTERGYGYRWQQARTRFLYANPLCRICSASKRLAAASIVDHIVPHRGDQALFWDETNWQPLCKPCHDGEKARQERREAQGA